MSNTAQAAKDFAKVDFHSFVSFLFLLIQRRIIHGQYGLLKISTKVKTTYGYSTVKWNSVKKKVFHMTFENVNQGQGRAIQGRSLC